MQWLYDFDLNTFRAINVGWHSSLLTPIFWALSYSGLGQVQFLLSALLLRKEETKKLAIALMVTIPVTGLLLAQAVKKTTFRDRPSNLSVAYVLEDFHSESFPSGHTTTSFAVATMILLFTWNTRYRWVGPLAMVWAALVGVSRVYRGVHWPTDAMAGACFGMMGSALIYWLFQRNASVKVKSS